MEELVVPPSGQWARTRRSKSGHTAEARVEVVRYCDCAPLRFAWKHSVPVPDLAHANACRGRQTI